MNIPIPRWLVRAWEGSDVWLNTNVYRSVRTIDILLLVMFLGCAGGYGWWYDSWYAAFVGGVLFLLGIILALLLKPGENQ